MKKYEFADISKVSEAQLEHLVSQYSDNVEKGLKYLDHQKQTDHGRLDVLLVDSGGSLVIAELKKLQDDYSLIQAVY